MSVNIDFALMFLFKFSKIKTIKEHKFDTDNA